VGPASVFGRREVRATGAGPSLGAVPGAEEGVLRGVKKGNLGFIWLAA